MSKTTRTRDMIKDNKTILTLTDEELKAAEKAADKDASDAENSRRILAAVRQMRANKAAEIKNRASYGETMTLDAILKAIKDYRTFKADVEKQIEDIRADGRYSDAYKRDQANMLQNKLSERKYSDMEAIKSLLSDVVVAREEYDRNFFTDPERLDNANRIIGVLRNAGGNIDIKDFVALTDPIYGDAAAARYIAASIKGDAIPYKAVIDEWAIDTGTAFNKSSQLIENLFSGIGQSWGVEQTLLNEAQRVGISLNRTDYTQPLYSDSRNISIAPQQSEAEALAMVREAMGVNPIGGGNNDTETE